MDIKKPSIETLSFIVAALTTPILLSDSNKKEPSIPESRCADTGIQDQFLLDKSPSVSECVLKDSETIKVEVSRNPDFVDCDDFSAKADLGLSESVIDTRNQFNCRVFIMDDLGQPQTINLIPNTSH